MGRKDEAGRRWRASLVMGLAAAALVSTASGCSSSEDADAAAPQTGPTATPTASPTATPAASPSSGSTTSADDTPDPVAPRPLRRPFADDFDGTALDPAWTWLHDAEGWPDAMRSVEVADGSLQLEPWTTAWFADFHGPYLFRELTGDFVVTARVRAAGLDGPVPRRTYSFAGLLARAPREVTPRTWRPGGEDHVFITSGVGDDRGVPMVETKTTDDSDSTLSLTPAAGGWTDLAIVRAGETFVMLFRDRSTPWQVSNSFARPDLPATVQVGIAVYTDWEGMVDLQQDPAAYHRQVLRRHPDLHADVDAVTARPLPPATDVAAIAAAGVGDVAELVVPLLDR